MTAYLYIFLLILFIQELEAKIISLVKNELKRFKNLLSSDYPACTEGTEISMCSVVFLFYQNWPLLATGKLKSKLRAKCQKIHEGISQQGTTALLNEIYTELYITEGGIGEVKNEHEIFREEFELQLGKVFSFVHLSVQEFLAAVYVFMSFISTNTNVLQQKHPGFFSIFKTPMSVFLNIAVDKALQSQNGHLDLFLRFLLGLSLESNQTLLRGLLTQTGSSSHSKEETVKYIKEKIMQEVQTYLSRGGNSSLHGARLSPAQWSALVFVLLNSEEDLDEFDLRKYDPSEECLLRLLPLVKASRKAILSGCGLTEESCKSLTSVLQTENSSLRELEMNNNDLQNSGVEQLCAGLKSSHCKLEIL
ncbi:hypothetical protein P4O66_020691, partial [Electrophorus voltai]